MEDYETVYHNLLGLLSFSLFNKTPNIIGELETDAVLRESINQKVFPLVFSAVSKLDGNYPLEKWQPLFDKNIAANIHLFNNHIQLHNLLKSNNINFFFLKGVVSAQYYNEPLLRTMGDVDFIVNKNDISTVTNLLKRNGFNKQKSNTHHISFKKADLYRVELHWQPSGMPTDSDFKSRVLSLIDNSFSKTNEINIFNGVINSPPHLIHGLTLLLHNAEHIVTSGIGLRHLCDWAVFVNNFSEDEFCNMFKETFEKIKIWDFCCCLTAICHKYLGSNYFAFSEFDETVVDGLFQDICASGEFANKEPERYNQSKFIGNYSGTFNSDYVGFKNLFRALFYKVKVEHTICEKYKILIPFFAINTLFKFAFKVIKGKRFTLNYKSDMKSAKERNAIYNKLNIFKK